MCFLPKFQFLGVQLMKIVLNEKNFWIISSYPQIYEIKVSRAGFEKMSSVPPTPRQCHIQGQSTMA